MNKKPTGFTLIEILVVIAILAIIASIALPNYRQQSQRLQRSSAQTMMWDIASHLSTHYLQNGYYHPDFINALNNDEALTYTPSLDNPQYRIQVSTKDNSQSYLITATPRDDSNLCGELTLDSSGRKTAESDRCW